MGDRLQAEAGDSQDWFLPHLPCCVTAEGQVRDPVGPVIRMLGPLPVSDSGYSPSPDWPPAELWQFSALFL